jgi:hypothetical protein
MAGGRGREETSCIKYPETFGSSLYLKKGLLHKVTGKRYFYFRILTNVKVS